MVYFILGILRTDLWSHGTHLVIRTRLALRTKCCVHLAWLIKCLLCRQRMNSLPNFLRYGAPRSCARKLCYNLARWYNLSRYKIPQPTAIGSRKLTAFTSGRRPQNASSEWNGQKSNIIVNLWQMYATVVIIETNVYSYFEKGCRKKCARDNPER